MIISSYKKTNTTKTVAIVLTLVILTALFSVIPSKMVEASGTTYGCNS